MLPIIASIRGHYRPDTTRACEGADEADKKTRHGEKYKCRHGEREDASRRETSEDSISEEEELQLNLGKKERKESGNTLRLSISRIGTERCDV